jgi:cytochrome c553
MKRALLRIGAWTLVLVLAALVVAASGVVPISARAGHWAVTRWFLDFTMRRSVALRSLGVHVPELDDPALVLRGAGHYELGCRPCHAAPGVAQLPVPAAMSPRPPDLKTAAPRFDDAELAYLVEHGIKMTGMPAWPARERADEVWAMVAFLRALPGLDAAGYRALVHGDAVAAGGLAAERCARCHGADGLGRGGAFPALAGQRREYLLASLRAFAAGERHSGTMQMVAAELGADWMAELADHYAALPPPRAQDPPAENELGAAIARLGIPARRVPSCADCHGPEADGAQAPRATYPRLAGQHADYLVQQLQLFAEGRRGGTVVAGHWRALAPQRAPEERRAVAAFYAALAPSDGR